MREESAGWTEGSNWLQALKSSHASGQWRSENRASRDLVAGQTDAEQNNRGTSVSFAHTHTHTHTQPHTDTLTHTSAPYRVVEPLEPVEPVGTGPQCVVW